MGPFAEYAKNSIPTDEERSRLRSKLPYIALAPLVSQPIPTFLCPSDAELPLFPTTHSDNSTGVSAGLNYIVSIGSGRDLNYDDRFETDGMFWTGVLNPQPYHS